MTKSGLTGYWTPDDDGMILISANGKSMITCFGLTAAASAGGTAYISDIDFLTAQEAVDRYPELSQTLGVTPTGLHLGPALQGSVKGQSAYDLSGRLVDAAFHGLVVEKGRKTMRQ